MRTHTLLSVWLLLCTLTTLSAQYQITGELKKWHKVTITFDGPATAETASVNPFTDYRLNVTFSNGNRTYVVPGYYAADGNAANSGADSGNKWRVHFAPDAMGTWTFRASFRQGDQVALSDSPSAGTAAAFDGVSGSFSIAATDKTGRDNRAKGRLQYVNGHYLRYAETGEYFIKIGADSPENFLSYDDFDNTPDYGGRRKSWAPHVQDWRPGDPTWQDGRGKGIIGAVNYLASEGQNAFSFLTLNINGDDDNTFPYIDDRLAVDRLRMDCSKLDQWEILFEHADRMGMYLHFKTQETENDHLLDGGALGPQRKLYYRELIARFSHHLALNWNIGEENSNTIAQRRAFAGYFHQHDPYQHHIVLHTYPHDHEAYESLTGDQSKFTGPSIQTRWSNVHKATLKWYDESALSGKPWVVANDEQGLSKIGVPHDGYTGSPSQADIRNAVLWGNLLAGGAGVEYYFGYDLPHSDLTCQDFRSRDRMWDYNRFAHQFFISYLPFWQMKNHNELIGNTNNNNDNFCFAKPGEIYAIYRRSGAVELDLQDFGGGGSNDASNRSFRVQWFNPRSGGALQDGSVTTINGSGKVNLGAPPAEAGQDWVILVTAGEISCPVAGTACDDGNPDTVNDAEDGNCNCAGEPKPDCPPVGTACDDGNPDTLNDVEDGNCNCAGGPSPDCPPAGTPCDDGNPDTLNDVEDGNCNCTGTPSSDAPFQLWLEAECFTAGQEWTVMDDQAASKGQYMLPPNRRSLNQAPSDPEDLLQVAFEVPVAGDYFVFVRAQTSNDADDSFWVRMNDEDWARWNKINVDRYGDGFQWDQVGNWTGGPRATPVTFTLAAGSHTLTFSWREPGVRIDKVLISDRAQAPQGMGAAAANECVPGCRPAGTPCDDGDPTTANDRFDDDCNCAGDPPPALSLTWLEAECSRVGNRWRPLLSEDASNGQYLVSPDGQSMNQAPETEADLLEFSFEATIAGTYYLYARTMTTNDGEDSFWFRLDGGEWIKWDNINAGSYGNRFQWEQLGQWTGGNRSQPLTFDLEAGNHLLHISWREPNVRIDKVFISSTPILPTGPGGDAGEQCENACPPAGTACDDGDPDTVNDVEDGLCNCVGTSPDDFWLEAECAEIGGYWTLQSGAEASNGSYLQPPNRYSYRYYPDDEADRIRFRVMITTAGEYKIFARTMTPSQNSNSFWVRVNDGRWLRWNKINQNTTSDRFLWDQVGNWIRGAQSTSMTFFLEEGENTIDFAWREPGTLLDKLYVTRTGGPPNGLGATAPACQPIVEGPPPPAPEPGERKRERWGLAEIRAFPNPFRDQLNINLALPQEENGEPVQLFLSDALGRMIRIIPLDAFDDQSLTLDLSGLPGGHYYLVLRRQSGTIPVKLIKIDD